MRLGTVAAASPRCSSSSIPMNVFAEAQRKIVSGWYGQRTEAAHGRHANVVQEEVGRMIEGIRDFTIRHPA
jgi:hypothetical protein